MKGIERIYDKLDYLIDELIKKHTNNIISEFVEDLKLTHPMIGFKYTRLELIEKWEDKLK